MAITSTNMGLKRWNVSSDSFSYSELSDNFNLIDAHDHTTGKGVQVPSGGIANGAVTLAKLAANSVDATKILDASVTDAELASPGSGVYRLLHQHPVLVNALAAGTYTFNSAGGSVVSGGTTASSMSPVRINSTSLAVPNKTTVLRYELTWNTNATAAGQTLTFGLASLASAGTAGQFTVTVTPAGTSLPVATPAASTVSATVSADLSLLANGFYVPYLTLSGAMAAGSYFSGIFKTFYRHT